MEELRRLANAMTGAIAAYNEAKAALLPPGRRVLVDRGWQGTISEFRRGVVCDSEVCIRPDSTRTAETFGRLRESGDFVHVPIEAVELLDE